MNGEAGASTCAIDIGLSKAPIQDLTPRTRRTSAACRASTSAELSHAESAQSPFQNRSDSAPIPPLPLTKMLCRRQSSFLKCRSFVSRRVSNIAHLFLRGERRTTELYYSVFPLCDLSIDPDVAKAVAIYLCQKMELSMTEIRAAAQVPVPAEKTSEGFGRRRFLAWSSTAWRDRLTVVRKPSHNQK
jgi:hypothetical protein